MGTATRPRVSRDKFRPAACARTHVGEGREERHSRYQMVAGSMKHLVEVEEGKEAAGGAPSAGPTYRCAAGGKGAAPPAVPGLDCCWDIFRCVPPFSPPAGGA